MSSRSESSLRIALRITSASSARNTLTHIVPPFELSRGLNLDVRYAFGDCESTLDLTVYASGRTPFDSGFRWRRTSRSRNLWRIALRAQNENVVHPCVHHNGPVEPIPHKPLHKKKWYRLWLN